MGGRHRLAGVLAVVVLGASCAAGDSSTSTTSPAPASDGTNTEQPGPLGAASPSGDPSTTASARATSQPAPTAPSTPPDATSTGPTEPTSSGRVLLDEVDDVGETLTGRTYWAPVDLVRVRITEQDGMLAFWFLTAAEPDRSEDSLGAVDLELEWPGGATGAAGVSFKHGSQERSGRWHWLSTGLSVCDDDAATFEELRGEEPGYLLRLPHACLDGASSMAVSFSIQTPSMDKAPVDIAPGTFDDDGQPERYAPVPL